MNLASASFPQHDIQSQMHKLTAPASSHGQKKGTNKFISAEELSIVSNLSEEFWIQQAETKQIMAVFDPVTSIWMFAPRAYKCFLHIQEQHFLASNLQQPIPNIKQSQTDDESMPVTSERQSIKDNLTDKVKAEKEQNISKDTTFVEVKDTKGKTRKYFKLNKSERSSVAETGRILLKQAMSQDSTPDYVTMLDLKVVPRKESGTYLLDLRGNREPIPYIKKILNCKSSRYSLGTKTIEEAKHKANQAMHEACIINKTSLLPINIEDKNLRNALAMSYTANSSKNAGTVDEMQQKLGFWNYVAGDISLNSINRYFVVSILDEMRDCGIQGSTRHSYAVELRKALAEAKENNLISSMPTIPSFASGRRDLIELPWKKWVEFVSSYAVSKLEKFLKLLWHIGQRHTNVLELDIKQINLESRLCHIPSTEHKSGEMIDIPLSESAVDLIEEIINYKKEVGVSGSALFADTNGTLPRIDKERWDLATKENNLNSNLTIHHVRHYFATDLRRNGASKETVAKAGGWHCTESLDRYDHTGITKNELDAVNNRTGINKNKDTTTDKNITINNGGGIVNIN